MDNLLLMTDGYKFSHYPQYPPGTTYVYSYLESRGGVFPDTTFFGLQYHLKKYLLGQVVTQEKIDEADAFVKEYMGPNLFNRKGWEHILHKHNGRLPVLIKAVPEGSVVTTKNVLMTIENTDPECYWLTNYLETLLLQVWYPTTVATLSRHMKETILEYLRDTGDVSLIEYKLHDFGFRGVSSPESAAIGGAAHLINFRGTDTVLSLLLATRYYGAKMPGNSIPASEHSTITSWGPKHESDAMENMLDKYPTGPFSCVSDSFDIIHACRNIWGDKLKDKVLQRNGTLVVRPDSGKPQEIVIEVLKALGDSFGYAMNSKGYKVLPDQVRVIQGDGVNWKSLREILQAMKDNGWSADNVAFGCGGALLQQLDRDTQRFAFKCSSITVNGQERDVYKDPITDPGKKSKRGRLKLVNLKNSVVPFVTINVNTPGQEVHDDFLVPVFKDGELLTKYTFDDVKRNAG